MIMSLLKVIPIIDSPMVERFWIGVGSPNKRASETLLHLEKLKLIEGQRRSIGFTKLWRLTKKGREQVNAIYHPKPFNSPQIEHILGLGKILLDLHEMGIVGDFRPELREPFTVHGKPYYFCADAYFVFNQRAYLLEYQRSPLTSEQWKAKWKIYDLFFQEAFKRASWNTPTRIIKPKIVVISTQQPSTIQQTHLPLIILKDIKHLGGI